MAVEFNRRAWLATVAVILLIAIVWKVIDYRMQPPPPLNKTTQPATR